jgi:site-specific DNA-cytosine methylase
MKPLCIDLFCGYGGWARGFLDAGYRVVGFDIEPKCAKRYPGEFVLADVRNLDGRRFAGARVIVASPPCQEFSAMVEMRRPRDIPRAMSLVREAERIIGEARPEFWAIENIQSAVPHISKDLGPPLLRGHAYPLWGNFPGFLLPSSRRLDKGMGAQAIPQGETHTREWVRLRRSLRKRGRDAAVIPYPLARALAEACLP